MIASIRKFLLFNLLLAIILITTLSAIGDYYLSQAAVRSHMDSLLEHMGKTFSIIVSSNIDKVDLPTLQKELDLLSAEPKNSLPLSQRHQPQPVSNGGKYCFQLWDHQQHLLLYSSYDPQLHLNIAPHGLSDLSLGGERWRVFKMHDNKRQLDFVVGERYDLRNQLLNQIAWNNLLLLLLTYLFAGALIWVVIGWGFKPLLRLTDEISQRVPSYLEPIDTRLIPMEIAPLAEAVNKLFTRLQEAFEREKRFAGDAAHELRTPLAALKTQAQIIAKSDNDEERQQLLENMVQSVDRITHIVQQLLTLSRLVPEAASIYDISEVSLGKLCADIIAQMYATALEKNIDIELLAPDKVPLIKGNVTSLSILIRNLLENAIAYTPDGGHVQVEIHVTPSHLALKVRDDGPGIPEELRKRVFERFYRIVGTIPSGSGLGLAIVKQIADLHQATVKLTTPPDGQGLQCEVWFLQSVRHNKQSVEI